MMNKAMNLFKDTSSQLYKECGRRGIESRGKSKEEIIAEIIWKDAYDAGRNSLLMNKKDFKTEPKLPCTYLVNDGQEYYLLTINESQKKLIDWLSLHDFFHTDVLIEDTATKNIINMT